MGNERDKAARSTIGHARSGPVVGSAHALGGQERIFLKLPTDQIVWQVHVGGGRWQPNLEMRATAMDAKEYQRSLSMEREGWATAIVDAVHKVLGVRVCCATGPFAGCINVMATLMRDPRELYEVQLINSAPVWGVGDVLIYYASDGRWYIGDARDKAAGAARRAVALWAGYARSEVVPIGTLPTSLYAHARQQVEDSCSSSHMPADENVVGMSEITALGPSACAWEVHVGAGTWELQSLQVSRRTCDLTIRRTDGRTGRPIDGTMAAIQRTDRGGYSDGRQLSVW